MPLAATGELVAHAAGTRSAVAHIEAGPAGSLTVPEPAGVSHNQLIRLFRAATGDTSVGCVRGRGLDRARHLLCASTPSVPAVAASVGILGLHAFDAACRRELGAALRALRAAATA
ncbi:helix-turn-helix domain-containing protein [Streptomyces shenzhenensis]|uniref:helix-turn-helix domain-containing protein n=1 Tax=Streptomyces shenzhenensis TaxID=943815 RepID=UPI0037F819AC